MPDTQKDLYKKLLGREGEKLTEKYLKKRGYKILARNYVTPFGEADIIAEKDGETVFVEVKTRSGNGFGTPAEAVGRKKRERYRKIAEYYFFTNEESDFSFAVSEVVGKEINLIKDAF